MALKFKLKLGEELKQKHTITHSLINKILYSKRLLVDHVEALEHCLQNENINSQEEEQQQEQDVVDKSSKSKKVQHIKKESKVKFEICTARHTCLAAGTTLLASYVLPQQLRLVLWPTVIVSSGFGGLYAIKKLFVFRNKLVERDLEHLINTIDEFGNCIRRNMTYFNEILIMKQQDLIESRQIERAWDCITAAKEVTEILYDATRQLEAQYPLPNKFMQYYSPMEELRDCEYFKTNITDYSPKHIKDFHNIFAYVQSQFLLRLALTVITKPSISVLSDKLVKINCQIKQLVADEEKQFKNLAVEMNVRKQLEIDELNATKIMQNRTGPVAVLQDSSLKLSARMVAVAAECQALDITLHRVGGIDIDSRDNAKELLLVAKNMRAIESALSVCFDDFQRLMLVYNKFLNGRLDALEANTPVQSELPEQPADTKELQASCSNEHVQQDDDDFYAYVYDEREEQLEQASRAIEDSASQEREILNFEKRLSKGKFRPVLQQLKDRIDPIRQVMLEKEREVLAAKGLNVDEFQHTDNKLVENVKNHEVNVDNENVVNNEDEFVNDDNDSDGSADLEYERRKKKLDEIINNQFEEMRNTLAQKKPINLYNLNIEADPSQAPASPPQEPAMPSPYDEYNKTEAPIRIQPVLRMRQEEVFGSTD